MNSEKSGEQDLDRDSDTDSDSDSNVVGAVASRLSTTAAHLSAATAASAGYATRSSETWNLKPDP